MPLVNNIYDRGAGRKMIAGGEIMARSGADVRRMRAQSDALVDALWWRDEDANPSPRRPASASPRQRPVVKQDASRETGYTARAHELRHRLIGAQALLGTLTDEARRGDATMSHVVEQLSVLERQLHGCERQAANLLRQPANFPSSAERRRTADDAAAVSPNALSPNALSPASRRHALLVCGCGGPGITEPQRRRLIFRRDRSLTVQSGAPPGGERVSTILEEQD